MLAYKYNSISEICMILAAPILAKGMFPMQKNVCEDVEKPVHPHKRQVLYSCKKLFRKNGIEHRFAYKSDC